MIRSMTGFGSASEDNDGAHYLVEVRSLNNKFLKAQVRLPEELQGLESELEAAAGRRLNRGSIVITVRFSDTSASAAATINIKALRRYLDQLLEVPNIAHDSTRVDLSSLLDLPGVLVIDTGEERVDRARQVLMRLLDQTCEQVLEMRAHEGRALLNDLHKHCDRIDEHLRVIEAAAPEVVKRYQERLLQRMQTLLEAVGASATSEDVLKEVAVYAERTDIAEEVSRLTGHLQQFREAIDSDDEEPVGRRLDFISQEMLREANTIASKCQDGDVARRIVEIKSAIDRIKEQAQNVE